MRKNTTTPPTTTISLYTPKVTCGVSGVVEHEENEEELCFLKVKQDCEQNPDRYNRVFILILS